MSIPIAQFSTPPSLPHRSFPPLAYNTFYAVETVPKQRKAGNIHKFISPKPDIVNTEKGTRISPAILKIDGGKKSLLKCQEIEI